MGRPINKKYFAPHTPSIYTTAFTVLGGASRATSHINKQTGSRSYKITSTDGTGVCRLQATAPTAVGQATLNATDSAGGTYYVTKLTEHKALLTQNTGTQFASDTEVHWTLGTAIVNYSVKLDNA